MKAKTKNKIFFVLQGLTKNISLPGFEKVRTHLYRHFFKELGANVQILDGITFKYPSDIIIKGHCKIGSGCFIVGLGGLEIHRYALIGSGTKIVTTTHNTTNIELPMAQQGLSTNPIIIHEDVWLGFNTIILGGSQIGKGSIIGASAVVTGKKIPDYSIVVGIPARIISNRLYDRTPDDIKPVSI
jgi:acetyltransferase-like isoleucine patch superfamily enzyme